MNIEKKKSEKKMKKTDINNGLQETVKENQNRKTEVWREMEKIAQLEANSDFHY